jgi:CubicO group peptidase (beta-lactamase class C family)
MLIFNIAVITSITILTVMKPTPYLRYSLIICLVFTTTITKVYGQKAHQLDSLFETLNKQHAISGCVLIAENGKPIYQKAFGYADVDSKQLNDNNTVFELASVSKQFTAMAIMQLHQKHLVGYDDDLVKYFPLWPYKGIKINNLLHHTSGLSDHLQWGAAMVDVNKINTNADILASLIKYAPPVYFMPGDSLSYSNTNYTLLALIVERVSGMPFAKYLDTHIFKPLGMNHTQVFGQYAANKKIKNYALGYDYDQHADKYVINNTLPKNRYEYFMDGVAGAYGICSTTGDMLKWDRALYTEKLVSKEEQSLAYEPTKLNNGKPAMLGNWPYGFGWLLLPSSTNHDGRTYMHSGAYPGYMSLIIRHPDENKTIIILTNRYNAIDMYDLGFNVDSILYEKPFHIPKATPHYKSITLTAENLKAIEGAYTIKTDKKITISTEAGHAYAQITGQPKFEILPSAELEFFYKVAPVTIKFVKDSTGVIKTLVLTQGNVILTGTRQ